MSKPILGIIGGGQLGSMLALAANKLEIKTIVFSDDIDAPAQNFSNEFIYGQYNDQKKINEFYCYIVASLIFIFFVIIDFFFYQNLIYLFCHHHIFKNI